MYEAGNNCKDIACALVTNWEAQFVTLAGYCYAVRHGMEVQLVTPYDVSHLQRYGVTVRGNVTSIYLTLRSKLLAWEECVKCGTAWVFKYIHVRLNYFFKAAERFILTITQYMTLIRVITMFSWISHASENFYMQQKILLHIKIIKS